MKQSQLYFLIAMLFSIGSFLANSVLNGMLMILVGFFFLLGSLLFMKSENVLERLEKQIEDIKFKLIVDLLSSKRKK